MGNVVSLFGDNSKNKDTSSSGTPASSSGKHIPPGVSLVANDWDKVLEGLGNPDSPYAAHADDIATDAHRKSGQ